MKIVAWNEWLDKHIPYYEADRHRTIMGSDPPRSVLIIPPSDNIRVSGHVSALANYYSNKKDYETIAEKILQYSNCRVEPLFLERDTQQCWYWAFWDDKKLTFLLLKLA